MVLKSCFFNKELISYTTHTRHTRGQQWHTDMNRFQLLGRSKHKRSSKNGGSDPQEAHPLLNSTTNNNKNSGQMHVSQQFLQLPDKILLLIISNLSDDKSSLLALCLTNKQIYQMVSKNFLYRHVKLHSKLSLLKFNIFIHSNENTKKRMTVQQIEFINPECQDSLFKYSKYYKKKSSNSTIAGSYEIQENIPQLHSVNYLHEKCAATATTTTHSASYFSSLFSRPENETLLCKYSKYTYIELMMNVIDYLPNLGHITLSDIDPGFVIPEWYSVLNDGTKDFFDKILKHQQSMTRDDLKTFKLSDEWIKDYQSRYYSVPRYKTLELVAKNKKAGNCILRPFYLFGFGVFEELILENMDIDSQSLSCPFEILPLQMKLDEKGYLDVHSSIAKLSLKNCNIIIKHGIFQTLHDYFVKVRSLKLLNLRNSFDLLLSNCFPLLQDLTIDCNSICFITDNSVKDEYYLSEQHAETELNIESAIDDTLSIAETLISPLGQKHSIKYPPSTTPVVIAYDLVENKLNNENAASTENGAKITKDQLEYFQSLNISNFYLNYHKFHKLWNKIPNCEAINLKIINIPFTNVFPLSPNKYLDFLYKTTMNDDQVTVSAEPILLDEGGDSYWWENVVNECFTDLSVDNESVELDSKYINGYRDLVNYKDITNVNLWAFLTMLSKFRSVEIHMLRKWLFCTPRSRYDWELLLKPLLNVHTPIKVKDKDSYVLYSYGNATTTKAK